MRATGDQFEDRAADWLSGQGWQIVGRNFLTPMGELDIIALHGRSPVFVEVKVRNSGRYAGAAAAVTRSKQLKIQRAARAYLKSHPEFSQRPCRFDVIAFEPRQSPAGHHLNWIRAAFSQ